MIEWLEIPQHSAWFKRGVIGCGLNSPNQIKLFVMFINFVPFI